MEGLTAKLGLCIELSLLHSVSFREGGGKGLKLTVEKIFISTCDKTCQIHCYIMAESIKTAWSRQYANY